MPFQSKDYILRMIEQLGRALSRLLEQIRGGSVDELPEIEADLNVIAHQAGLDLKLAHSLSRESLSILVGYGDDLDPSRCWLLAELLYLHGLQTEKRTGEAAARESYSRSLYLYRMVRPEWQAEIPLPAAPARVAELERRLGNHGATN